MVLDAGDALGTGLGQLARGRRLRRLGAPGPAAHEHRLTAGLGIGLAVRGGERPWTTARVHGAPAGRAPNLWANECGLERTRAADPRREGARERRADLRRHAASDGYRRLWRD